MTEPSVRIGRVLRSECGPPLPWCVGVHAIVKQRKVSLKLSPFHNGINRYRPSPGRVRADEWLISSHDRRIGARAMAARTAWQ